MFQIQFSYTYRKQNSRKISHKPSNFWKKISYPIYFCIPKIKFGWTISLYKDFNTLYLRFRTQACYKALEQVDNLESSVKVNHINKYCTGKARSFYRVGIISVIANMINLTRAPCSDIIKPGGHIITSLITKGKRCRFLNGKG